MEMKVGICGLGWAGGALVERLRRDRGAGRPQHQLRRRNPSRTVAGTIRRICPVSRLPSLIFINGQ